VAEYSQRVGELGSVATDSRDGETACPHCGQITKTIAGRCPNCGAFKDARRMPASARGPIGSFWEDLDAWVQTTLVIAPLAVFAVLGAIFLAPEIAIVVVIVIVGYALLNGFFAS
jgi:hypothetical protein